MIYRLQVEDGKHLQYIHLAQMMGGGDVHVIHAP